MSKTVKSIVSISICVFLIGVFALAKRGPIPDVEPVIRQGVKFIAPNTPQKVGCVEAWDVASNEIIWEKKVYDVEIDSSMEADVQWIFIKSLNIQGDKLIVVNEKNDKFKIDISSD